MVSRIKGSGETLFNFDELAREAVEYGRQSAAEDAEKVTGEKLYGLLKTQGYRCYYTGKKLTMANVSLDHRHPLCRGGKHVMSNVALCTKVVNRMKGQMSESEFIETCRTVATH